MTIILVADNNWAIGKNGNLLARLPEDMKRFREITTGHTVVMGRKTYESFPKRPLPDRVNCVISRTQKEIEGAEVFGSVEEFLQYAKGVNDEIFVIGGGEIYSQFLPYCDKAYITRVYESFEGDTFFTDIDALPEWEAVKSSDIIETNGFKICFIDYVRKGAK